MGQYAHWRVPGRPCLVSTTESGAALNSPYFDGHLSVSSDGQLLYFISNRPGGYGDHDIWVSEWTGSGCGQPVNLGPRINTSNYDISPYITADGRSLFFASYSRPGGYGHYDVYKSTRLRAGWSEPENLGPEINSNQQDCYPWVDTGENVLYFSSEGHGGFSEGDLFYSHWTGWDWDAPVNVGDGVNSANGDAAPELTADMLTLYFHSDRPGGSGNVDLYLSNWQFVDWSESDNLGPVLNSIQYDGQPSISADGTTLYFGSERPGGVGDRDISVSKLLGWSAQGPFWSPPKNPGTPLNSAHFDSDPCVSQDGRLLYFMSSRPPGSWSNPEIWVSQWIDGIGWGEPTILPAPLNSPYWDRNPQISPDGQTILHFNSRGHGAIGEDDIFRSDWTGSEWSDPVSLGDGVNTIHSEGSASLALTWDCCITIHSVPEGKATVTYGSASHPV